MSINEHIKNKIRGILQEVLLPFIENEIEEKISDLDPTVILAISYLDPVSGSGFLSCAGRSSESGDPDIMILVTKLLRDPEYADSVLKLLNTPKNRNLDENLLN